MPALVPDVVGSFTSRDELLDGVLASCNATRADDASGFGGTRGMRSSRETGDFRSARNSARFASDGRKEIHKYDIYIYS